MRLLLLAGLVGAAACTGPAATPRDTATVTVFAAASLRGALDDIDARVMRPRGLTLRLTYAGTPQLARQIEAGAPADVFISADEDWMDVLARGTYIRAETRVTLAGNALVVIATASDRTPELRLDDPTRLRERLGDGRLAIAAPESVPAGRYAKQALTALGLWAAVADRLAPHDNVRAALAIVAAGEAPLGVVYASDAAAEPRVRVVATVPPHTHAPIRYPAALTRTTARRAREVLTLLQAPDARAIFAQHGFGPPS